MNTGEYRFPPCHWLTQDELAAAAGLDYFQILYYARPCLSEFGYLYPAVQAEQLKAKRAWLITQPAPEWRQLDAREHIETATMLAKAEPNRFPKDAHGRPNLYPTRQQLDEALTRMAKAR